MRLAIMECALRNIATHVEVRVPRVEGADINNESDWKTLTKAELAINALRAVGVWKGK